MTGISYKDSNGATQTVTLNYALLTLMSTTQGQYYTPTPPFALPVQNNCPTCHIHIWVNQPNRNASYWMLTSIVLPSGKSYAFTYNGYGELTKIQYPTGGYTAYDYGAFTHEETYWLDYSLYRGSDFREVTARRICRDPSGVCGGGGTPEDLTTFAPIVDSTKANNASIDVVDPLGYKNHHEFSQVNLQYYPKYYSPRELLHQVYSETGTLLRTVQTDYTYLDGSFCSDCWVYPLRVTTTLNDSSGTALVSKIEYTYDTYTARVMYPPYFPQGGTDYTNQSPTNRTRDVDNPVTILEYAYGSGAPGPLLRKKTATWLHVQGWDYAASLHIMDRKTNDQVQDPSANKLAETQYEYDSFTEGITSSGAVQHDSAYGTSYTYRGKLTAIKRWRNSDGAYLTTRFQYDDAGNGRKMVDPLLHPTTMSYADSWGNSACAPGSGNAAAYLTSVTNALGQITRATYNSCSGTMASLTDVNSQTSTYSYDLLNRLTQTSLPDGGQTTICYTDMGGAGCTQALPPFKVVTTKKIDSVQNLISTTVVDGLGRITQTQLNSDQQGIVYTDTTYDGNGRKSTISNPYRSQSDGTYGITTYKYDALDRTCVVIPPDGTAASGNSCPTTAPANDVFTSYGGNTTTVTDQAGKKRKSASDALGRLITVWEPDSSGNFVNETDYTYDVLNNLTSVVQSGSRQRTFTYNSLSQLTSASNPESGTIGYTYDADGNLLTKADARNITTTYAYDQLHRLTGKTFSNLDPALSYFYDQTLYNGLTIANGIGRRTGMSDAAGAEAWSYDAMGHVLTERRTTNAVSKNTSYTYNLDGSIATLTYPSGRVITYAYSAAARPLSGVDTANVINYALSASYAPHGALASLLLGQPNVSPPPPCRGCPPPPPPFQGMQLNYAYNPRLQPAGIRAWSTNGIALDLTYSFDLSAANTVCQTNLGTPTNNGDVAVITNNLNSARTQTFCYDQLNRIQKAQTQATTGQYAWGLSFGYDPWANLLSANVTQGSAPMLSVGVNAQNQVNNPGFSYDPAGNLLNDGSYGYTYDAENRMKTGAGVMYTYDGDGKRVQKSNGKLYWYGMGTDVLDESDATGNITDEYVFFGGNRIAHSKWPSAAINYYFADHLGTARVVTSATGTILDDSDFYPFGGERIVVSSSGNNYKFTGKERDSESGLDNFTARYFGSSMGRFMSPDPDDDSGFENQDDPQSWNAYAYVRNNPLNLTDPSGEVFCRSATDAEMRGLTQVCDVTNTEYVNDPSKYKGYTHYDCSCDTDADKAAYARFQRDQLPPGVADMLHQAGVTADNGVKAGALFMAENAAGLAIGRGIGLGIEAINAARAANAAAEVAEISNLVAKAASTVGNQGAVASSKAAALAAAEQFLGPGARAIRAGRGTGEIIGAISADGQRVVRYTSIDKASPYINLENKLTGGHLHI